jgi:antirestriction protein
MIGDDMTANSVEITKTICTLIGTIIFPGLMTMVYMAFTLKKMQIGQGEAAIKVAEVAEKQDLAVAKVAEVARLQDTATIKVAEVAARVATVAEKQDLATESANEFSSKQDFAVVNMREVVSRVASIAAKQDAATTRATEMAKNLDTNTAVTKATHNLVDGVYFGQLKKCAETSRTLANLTKNANDIKDAEAAEELMAQHKTDKSPSSSESKPT